MTDPSSSTPASPESRCSDCWATNCEDRPKPCRCTCHRKCQAEDTTPVSPPTEPVLANEQLKSEDWIASTHPEYRGAWSAATVEEYTASLTRDLELYKRCLATADKALDAVCNTIPCPPGYNAVQIMQLLGDLRESREKIAQLETEAASVRAASTGTGWIPVSEKLPPKNEPVIVFDSMYDEVGEGQISAYGWEKSIGKDDCEITAWQPFPAPPVASQKGKEEE